jgi:CHAD domain-containing protein
MLAREAGTREGKDAEDLHAMRVATRRMRAAWRVFGESFRPDRTKRYRSRLRDIAGRLGAVRDLDVLIEAAQAYRLEQPADEARALRPLFDAWTGFRDDARLLLLRELDGDGYARFVEDFRVFVQTEGAGTRSVTPVEPHHIRDTMPSRAWAAFEQLRGYEPVLRWADVETLHDLRIAAKWLRYTIEFVREPLEPDATALVGRVVALQDHLGLMHDADVAASMARTFLVERSSGLTGAQSAAIGRYLMSREREVARLRRSVGRPWRGVAGPAFRNRLGRAFARL